MAQGKKMPDAGTGAGARREAAPSAYGGIEAGRLVLLAKPLPSGAGYSQPFAVVRFEDLPEELRRQIAGASGHGGAARPRDPNAAPVAAPLRGKGDARYDAALPVDVVPEERLRRQLPRLVSGPNDKPTVKFAGDGNSDAVKDYSERCMLRVLGDMEGSPFEKEKGFSHAWMGHSGDEVCAQHAAHAYMSVFYDNGLPARKDAALVVALLLGNNRVAASPALDCSDDLAFPRELGEDAVPFVETLLGNGRATEQGVYYYDVLVPPENVVPAAEPLRASRSPTYAVQVSVDAAAGGKAGDPIAAGVKAAGTDAGHEHGSLSAVLGIVVASSAATALAAGTVGPATAFGLFTALVGGLSLAMSSIRAQ